MMAGKDGMTTETTQDRPLLVRSKSLLDSCDFCEAQEEGGHYCLIHSCQLKNANLWTCADFKRSYMKRKTRDESNTRIADTGGANAMIDRREDIDNDARSTPGPGRQALG